MFIAGIPIPHIMTVETSGYFSNSAYSVVIFPICLFLAVFTLAKTGG